MECNAKSYKEVGDMVTVDGYGLGHIIDYNGTRGIDGRIRIQWANGRRTTHDDICVQKVIEASGRSRDRGWTLIIAEEDGDGQKKLLSPREIRFRRYSKSIR